MPNWSKSPAASQHIGVLLFDGFSNHCLANTIEPLRAANSLSRKQVFNWEFLTINGDNAQSSSGLQVAPHKRLHHAAGDILVVMPSYGFRRYISRETQVGLRRAARQFKALAGLDTGSWLLAEAGLLEHRCATIHWEEMTSFAERFPEIDVQRERFVIDGNRITCSGAMAAFDLVLHLIGRDHGQALALEVSQLFMSHGFGHCLRGGAEASSRIVKNALAIMQDNLENPITIAEIARQAKCTQKVLEVRMKSDLGATPQQIYRRQRLNLARKLAVGTDLRIAEITVRCGYADAAAMTRAFRNEFGATPRDLRRI